MDDSGSNHEEEDCLGEAQNKKGDILEYFIISFLQLLPLILIFYTQCNFFPMHVFLGRFFSCKTC